MIRSLGRWVVRSSLGVLLLSLIALGTAARPAVAGFFYEQLGAVALSKGLEAIIESRGSRVEPPSPPLDSRLPTPYPSKGQALGYLAEAERLYGESLHLNGSGARLYVKLGIIYLMTDRLDLALDHFLRAAQLSPGDPQTSLWLGMAYARSGQLSLAADLFKEAKSKDQLLFWGNLYFGEGDFRSAALFFRAAATTPPRQGYAFRRLGETEEELGHTQEAIDAYRSFVELQSTDLAQRDMVQANVHMLENRWSEAATIYESLLRNDAQRPVGSLAIFRSPAAGLEGNFQLHFNLGMAYYRLARLDDAVRELEAAVHLRLDRDKWYYRLLADAYYDKGDLSAGLYWYRQVLEVDPTDRHASDRAQSLSYRN